MSRRRKDIKTTRDIKSVLAKSVSKSENHECVSAEEGVESPVITDCQLCGLTTVLLLAVYTASLQPSVGGGDSGELINAAHELGVAHPPGYPLFTLLARLSMLCVPWGSPAWRVNLLSALCSALAGGLLQMSVLKLTGDVGSSLLAVGLFSLSKLTWTWSVTAEVFALNDLFVALLLLLTILFEFKVQEGEGQGQLDENVVLKLSYLGAFVCGLSLCNQHTIVLYVLPIAVWVMYTLLRLKLLSTSRLLLLALSFLLGLLPYAFLSLSAHLNTARWTWGDQRSLDGFLRHVLRQEYGTWQLGKDSTGQGFVAGITAYFEHCSANLGGLALVFAVIGCVTSVTIRQSYGEGSLFVFILMLTSYVTFFAWRANLDISEPLFKGVVERFWLQSDLVLCLLAAVGFHPSVRFLTEKTFGEAKVSLHAVFTTICGITVIALNLQNFQECNESRNLVIRDFAQTVLTHLPDNAIVLSKGDLPTNSMRYLHLCEGVRQDITLVDMETLTYPWSLPMLRQAYTGVEFPGDFWHSTAGMWADGRKSFNMNQFLHANYDRAGLFACIGMTDRDLSWQQDFTLWPFGPCHKVVKKTEVMEPARWGEVTGRIAEKWTYPYTGYLNTSWEKVANDEMWNAKISSAFYMYSQSEEATDALTKKHFLLAAYDLYHTAIKSNQEAGRRTQATSFPVFWHKNFALVCERLLYVDSHHKKSLLCKTSVLHFEQYILAEGRHEPEIRGLVEAVRNLRDRIHTYEQLDVIQQTFEPRVKH